MKPFQVACCKYSWRIFSIVTVVTDAFQERSTSSRPQSSATFMTTCCMLAAFTRYNDCCIWSGVLASVIIVLIGWTVGRQPRRLSSSSVVELTTSRSSWLSLRIKWHGRTANYKPRRAIACSPNWFQYFHSLT